MTRFGVQAPWLAVALAGCSINLASSGDGDVDPSDPDQLSSVLVIPGATRVDGDPPAASGGPGAPSITGGAALGVASGDQAVLSVQFQSRAGYRNCRVRVEGARTYFNLSGNNSASSGEIRIPVNVPGSVGSGSFRLITSIDDANGSVSNPVATPVSVTSPRTTGGGGGTVCQNVPSSCDGQILQSCVSDSGCWYVVGAQRFDCAAGCNCAAAAQSASRVVVASCR